MSSYDAVFVGSGINSLAGAAILSRAGWSVCVLERNDVPGGCIRTSSELTLPGFTHEVLASWHPLFTGSPAYAELKDELDRRGVEYLNTDLPTGSAFPDGSAAFVTTSLAGNVAELDRHAAGDGANWEREFTAFMENADLAFGLLGTELWSGAGLSLGRKAYRRLGRRGLLEFAGGTLSTCRDWLQATFASEQARGLLAPWVLHTGLGPDQATSGFMTRVIAAALQLGGMPVPAGGGARLVDALRGIVTDAGGDVRTGADADRILVANGRATGVRLSDGDVVTAGRAVVASVTPTQLYGRLLARGDAPAAVTEAAARFRYGRAEMQIHLALDELPRWKGSDADRLARCPIVHVTPGLDGVSRAVNEAERGLLPTEATIVCGQPVAVDPSRAPAGKWIVWIQLQELPAGKVKGDAAGEIDTGDGSWTEELREAYADRVVARLGESITNLGSATLKRVVLSPVDIEALNVNLVDGDIYGGVLRARPEPALAPPGRGPRPRHRRRPALAHRREHASGPGARSGVRLSRRQGADEAGAAAAPPGAAPRSLVRLGCSAISTVGASFEDDVAAYASAGLDAIGLWEFKLPESDTANVALLRQHGLAVASCVPSVPSLLQLGIPGMEGPPDPAERIAAICASVRRLAAFDPECVLCLAGPLGGRAEGEARAIVVDGLRRIGAAAAESGVRLGFEPTHPAERETTSFVVTVAEAVAILDEAELKDAGVMVDTYNLWDDDRAGPWLRANGDRVAGLHVCDVPADGAPGRALPGTNGGRTRELVDAARAGGWDGTLDVEIFSTPDGFWGLSADEAARRAYEAARQLVA